MTIIVLTAVPAGLRGHLTRWLMEIAPGVFVGKVSSRVRDQLWLIVQDMIGNGRGLLVHTARNEQGFTFHNCGHAWEPIDIEGITLMLRPSAMRTTNEKPKDVKSLAARYRRVRHSE